VGCEYLSPDDVHRIVDGLPAGTTIELSAFHKDFICAKNTTCSNNPNCFIDSSLDPDCDEANGTVEAFESKVQFHLRGTGPVLGGWERDVLLPDILCKVQAGPRNPADPVQSLPTSMLQMQGQIIGDPDFDLLRLTAGNNFSLPSPGHTTLTRQADGKWRVDSFFDITYRIDFVGAPGGPLGGMSGSTTGTIRMVAAASPAPIPTVSQWGLIILTLSLLTVCTLFLRRQRLGASPAAA
jgi:hypothetical protein